jgi:hypothetical protein
MDLSSNATGAGGMTLLSTQTASSDSTISFTSGIDSTYKEYVFRFYDIHPETDGQQFKFQADTGTNTSYNQTLTTTFFKAQHAEDDSATEVVYEDGMDLAQSSSFQSLTRSQGSDNDQAWSGYLHIFAPSSSVFVKHFIARTSVVVNNDRAEDNFIAGYFNTTTALTRFQFKFASGDIDAGTIKMYGVS